MRGSGSNDDAPTLRGPATLGSLAPHGDAAELPLADTLGVEAAAAAAAAPLEAPRYALREQLGRGGMGEVHTAHDAHVDREVAVKLLRGAPEADAVARFLREARVQGRLEHPAIVPVHDLGLDGAGRPYFAMKRLAGTTLAALLAAHAAGEPAALARWPRRALLGRLVEVCHAVEFAHRRGVVHRDLKPANIMLGDLGEAYVLDWGIARVAGRGGGPAIRNTDLVAVEAEPGHTAEGALLGTPGYMAPEQIADAAGADARADVYALGCVLFEVLTLHPALPRGLPAVAATLEASAFHPRDRHPDADVPPELDAACAAATAPDRGDRLATAGELAARIQAYLDGDRDLARRRELAAEHAAAARAAFARGDDLRAEAMRDAGRALALDPTNTDAQQLLGRLLLEPPAVIPPAVRAAVAAERVRAGQVQLRSAAKIYAGSLLLVPLVLALGVRVAWPAAVCAALMVAGVVGTWWQSRRAVPVGRLFHVALALHAALLAASGVLLGPLLLLPLLAVGSSTTFALTPTARSPAANVVAHALAFAAPLALELAGVVPRTFGIDAAGLHLHPWAVALGGGELVALLALTLAGQLVANVVLVARQRRIQEAAQEDVHLRSWHLRQLAG